MQVNTVSKSFTHFAANKTQTIKDTNASEMPEKKEVTAADVLQNIKEEFKNVHFVTGEVKGREDIKQYAVSSGTGIHVIVSEEFLKKMAENEEAMEKGLALIERLVTKLKNQCAWGTGGRQGYGAVIDENGNASTWQADFKQEKDSLQKMLERFDEDRKRRAEAAKKQSLIKIKKKVTYSSSRVSGRILKARNITTANSALSYASRNLYQLKRDSNSGKYDAQEINRAISHAQNAVNCARTKIKHLKSEAQTQKRVKKAEKQRQFKKMQKLKIEAEKRRKNNRLKEYNRLYKKPNCDFISRQQENEYKKELYQAMFGISPSFASAPTGEISSSGIESVSEAGGSTVSVSISIEVTA